jgi:hypothetical protein
MTTKPAVTAAINLKAEQIAAQLAHLQLVVAGRKADAAKPGQHYGHVGDLDEVSARLQQIIDFIGA